MIAAEAAFTASISSGLSGSADSENMITWTSLRIFLGNSGRIGRSVNRRSGWNHPTVCPRGGRTRRDAPTGVHALFIVDGQREEIYASRMPPSVAAAKQSIAEATVTAASLTGEFARFNGNHAAPTWAVSALLQVYSFYLSSFYIPTWLGTESWGDNVLIKFQFPTVGWLSICNYPGEPEASKEQMVDKDHLLAFVCV